jgi:hypothetical protein
VGMCVAVFLLILCCKILQEMSVCKDVRSGNETALEGPSNIKREYLTKRKRVRQAYKVIKLFSFYNWSENKLFGLIFAI